MEEVAGKIEILVDLDRLERLTAFQPHGKKVSVSIFIREKLGLVPYTYPYELWLEWRAVNKKLGYKYPTYAKFRVYMWQLKELGLVEPFYTAPSYGYWDRNLYRIVPEYIDDKRWFNPNKALIEERDWVKK